MILTAPRPSESTHWYTRDGSPMYTVTGKNGKERPTTLRDARQLNLVPSVTTILNVAAKPALNAWMQRQVLMAALTLPKRDNESEDDYISRIVDDSREQGRAAADAGTSIHEAIQSFYEGKAIALHREHVEGCVQAISRELGEKTWICESPFAHELGFGGKADIHSKDGIVIDIKTKEFTEEDTIGGYDEHMMQLAAYRVGLGIPEARCFNVFVSRNVPGLSVLKEWPEEDLKTGWQMFTHLLSYYQLKNDYK